MPSTIRPAAAPRASTFGLARRGRSGYDRLIPTPAGRPPFRPSAVQSPRSTTMTTIARATAPRTRAGRGGFALGGRGVWVWEAGAQDPEAGSPPACGATASIGSPSRRPTARAGSTRTPSSVPTPRRRGARASASACGPTWWARIPTGRRSCAPISSNATTRTSSSPTPRSSTSARRGPCRAGSRAPSAPACRSCRPRCRASGVSTCIPGSTGARGGRPASTSIPRPTRASPRR